MACSGRLFGSLVRVACSRRWVLTGTNRVLTGWFTHLPVTQISFTLTKGKQYLSSLGTFSSISEQHAVPFFVFFFKSSGQNFSKFFSAESAQKGKKLGKILLRQLFVGLAREKEAHFFTKSAQKALSTPFSTSPGPYEQNHYFSF